MEWEVSEAGAPTTRKPGLGVGLSMAPRGLWAGGAGAEALVELQKKVSEILGIELKRNKEKD
jgi:hypothetical protein